MYADQLFLLPFPSSWPTWAPGGRSSIWYGRQRWRRGDESLDGGRQGCCQLHHASLLVSEQLQKVRLVRLPVQVELLEELTSGALFDIFFLLLLNDVLLQLCILEILASLPESLLQPLELLGASARLVRMLFQSGPSEHLHHILHLWASWHLLLEAEHPQECPELWVHFPLHSSSFKCPYSRGYVNGKNTRVCFRFLGIWSYQMQAKVRLWLVPSGNWGTQVATEASPRWCKVADNQLLPSFFITVRWQWQGQEERVVLMSDLHRLPISSRYCQYSRFLTGYISEVSYPPVHVRSI